MKNREFFGPGYSIPWQHLLHSLPRTGYGAYLYISK